MNEITRLTRITRFTRLTQSDRAAGFTLVELLTVMAIIAVMALLVLPGFTRMISSNKEGAALNLIRAALVEAQVHAAQTQKYAGIRFQFDKNGWAGGRQYLVLIEKSSGSTNADEYNAAPNAKPTALPEGIGVIDYSMLMQYPVNQSQIDDNNYNLSDNDTNRYGLLGSTTFSILFSPTGQLVVKNIYINRWDEYDQVFNSDYYVNLPPVKGQLPPPLLSHDRNWPTQSEYGSDWCRQEDSAKGFYIFEVNKMLQDVNPGTRWSDYIGTVEVEPVLINMYTGTIIRN